MAQDAELARRLRDLLLERSVSHGDFVLSSGNKSSYYIDARRTTMCAEGLVIIGQLGLTAIRQAGWQPYAAGGLTLGADPVAYAVAYASLSTGSPIDAFTVRKTPKEHGTRRRIEGVELTGRDVVVVEDVITSGASAREAIEVVTHDGARVLGVLAVVDRLEGGRESLERAGHRVISLTTARELGLGP